MLDEVIDLEIVHPDPVELEVHGDAVDDIHLVSERGRQPTLVGDSLVPLSPASQERLRGDSFIETAKISRSPGSGSPRCPRPGRDPSSPC